MCRKESVRLDRHTLYGAYKLLKQAQEKGCVRTAFNRHQVLTSRHWVHVRGCDVRMRTNTLQKIGKTAMLQLFQKYELRFGLTLSACRALPRLHARGRLRRHVRARHLCPCC